METGKISGIIRVTENGLVSGVDTDREFMSCNSAFQKIGDRLNPLGKSVFFCEFQIVKLFCLLFYLNIA